MAPKDPPSLAESGWTPRRGSAALARLARAFTRPRPVVTRFTRLHAWLLRRGRGRLRRSFLFAAGMPVLSLTTTGRRSGRERSTVVAYMEDGDRLVITAANLGNENPPAWYHNLIATPEAVVEVEGRRRSVTARLAENAEAEELWRKWLRLLPGAATFQHIAGRRIPVIVLEQRSVPGHPGNGRI